MKAILAYGPDVGGPFTDWGLIRPIAGRSYRVEAIPAADRAGTSEPSGYQVTLTARALTVRQSFFDFDNYFWRITYPETGQIILVGDFPYIFSSLGVLRRLHLRGMGDDSSTILLNRQAAYVGSVVFCETEMEGPLGPLTLVVKADKIMNFIDWLAPH